MVPLSGLQARTRGVAGFRVSETHHARGALPAHAHAAAGLCLLLDGALSEVRRGRAVAVGPGELIVRPAGDEHADRFGAAGATCLNIEYLPRDGASLGFGTLTSGPPVWLATRVRAALLADDALDLEHACWALVRAVAPSPDTDRAARPWLAVIDRLIATRFTEPWSLAALAAEVEVHPAHLARAFRRAHGTSIVAALLHRRVAAAAARLATSRAALAEIATGAGFYDQPHFTRMFRRATGLTPAAYRRAAGSDRTRRRAR
ncbi:MAG: AraC family transcriptional regulator [Kofleriaceae bacterium]